MKQLHCAADQDLKSSLDSCSLINVACDVPLPFSLNSSDVDEIKYCVN
jgi:hypothetical protein